jgi:hypothetical protein
VLGMQVVVATAMVGVATEVEAASHGMLLPR